jgi:DNA-binding beta-propeller fold protein YncE
MKRILVCIAFLIFFNQSVWSQESCNSQVLVSDFLANNVLIFNGCDGSFVRNLDSRGRLTGPQALVIGPDGMLYVASEDNGRVVRYTGDTLQFVDIFIEDDPATAGNELGGVARPIALAFASDGDLLVAGFQSNNIGRFDGQTGNFKSLFVSAGSGGLGGPDAGMVFGPDGNLYVPGFNSNNVIRYNGQTGAFMDVFASNIAQPRTVLFSPDGSRMLVSSWGDNQVVEYDAATGALIGQFGNPAPSPSGIAYAANGDLLVATDQRGQVSRRDSQTGSTLSNFISNNSSPLSSGTFILTIGSEENPTPAEASTNDQYWIIGLGDLIDNSLTIDEALTSNGGVFGADFDPALVQTPVWGSIVIQFTSCSTAELSYAANDGNKAFGAGGYSMTRVAANSGQRACEADGFGNTPDASWASGAWFGGPERSGEGILIDVLEEDLTFIAWFTYGADTTD